MKYFGGKYRQSKVIAEFINKEPLNKFLEPFVGGFNIVPKLRQFDTVLCSDLDENLIALYNYLLQDQSFNGFLSDEKNYKLAKNKPYLFTKENLAFLAYGCSFSGGYFNGYAKSHKTFRDYPQEAKDLLKKKFNLQSKVIFNTMDYRKYNPRDFVIYLDPPYGKVTKKYSVKTFDTDEFVKVAQRFSKNNIVYISEYKVIDGFKVVHEFIRTATSLTGKRETVEYLMRSKN